MLKEKKFLHWLVVKNLAEWSSDSNARLTGSTSFWAPLRLKEMGCRSPNYIGICCDKRAVVAKSRDDRLSFELIRGFHAWMSSWQCALKRVMRWWARQINVWYSRRWAAVARWNDVSWSLLSTFKSGRSVIRFYFSIQQCRRPWC